MRKGGRSTVEEPMVGVGCVCLDCLSKQMKGVSVGYDED